MGELKQRTVNGLLWKTANVLFNQGVTFIVSLVLARLLTPQDYGMLAMIAVFTAVLGIFTDGGLTAALIRKENRTEEDMATVFWYNLTACYLLYVICFIIAPYVADFYAMPQLKNVMRATTLGLLVSPFGGMQSTLLTIRLDFKTPAFISATTSIISGVIGIVMAYSGAGVWALVVQGLSAGIMGTAVTCWIVRWYPKTFFSKKSFRDLFGFSSKMLVSQCINTIYSKIAPLFIGKYYSPTDLGVVERGKGWAFLPTNLVTGTVTSVTFPVLSKIQDDDDKLRDAYRKMIRLSAFIVFPVTIGLASIGRPLTLSVLTEKWEGSIVFLYIYCFVTMWMPIHGLNLNLLLVKGRSDLTLRLEIIKKAVGLIIMAITLPLGLVWFAFGEFITASVVALAINLYYTGKILNLNYYKQMSDMMPIFMNCLVMAMISLLVQIPFDSNLVKLLVGIPAAAAYYVITARRFHREEYSELLSIVRKRGK